MSAFSVGIRKLRFGRPFRRLRRDGRLVSPIKSCVAFLALIQRYKTFVRSRSSPYATAATEIPDMEGEIFAECGEIFPLPRSPTVARPTDLPKEGEEARLEGKIAPTDRDRPDARIAHNAMNTKASVGTNSIAI